MVLETRMSRVIWIIHAACPSRCAYCAIDTQQQLRSLPAEAGVAVARDLVAAGFDEVILVGGEPLLYPHLGAVLDELRGKAEVALFTGGLPGDPARSVGLVERGIGRVVFSVDVGRDAENDLVRGRVGVTRDVEALAIALRAKLPRVGLSVNTVVSAANVRVLDSVWERFSPYGLDSWSLTLVGDNFREAPASSLPTEEDVARHYLETVPRLARLIGRAELVVLPVPLPFLEHAVPPRRWDVEAPRFQDALRDEFRRFARGAHNRSFVTGYGCPLAGRDVTIGVQGEVYPCSQAPILLPEHVVGELHDGWRIALATLAFERGASTLGQQLA